MPGKVVCTLVDSPKNYAHNQVAIALGVTDPGFVPGVITTDMDGVSIHDVDPPQVSEGQVWSKDHSVVYSYLNTGDPGDGSATVTKQGKTYHISGSWPGNDNATNEQVPAKPVEITVTCPEQVLPPAR